MSFCGSVGWEQASGCLRGHIAAKAYITWEIKVFTQCDIHNRKARGSGEGRALRPRDQHGREGDAVRSVGCCSRLGFSRQEMERRLGNGQRAADLREREREGQGGRGRKEGREREPYLF